MKLIASVVVFVATAGSALGQTSFELDPTKGLTAAAGQETDPDRAAMAEVRRLLAEDKFKEAYEKVHAWLEKNGESDSPVLADAYVLRGTALVGLGREFKALFDFEKVAREYPGSAAFTTALERELEVGNKYLNGLRRKSFGIRWESGVDVAEEIIVRINERLPGSRLAEQALMDLADYYYRERDLEMAAIAYDCFVILYPKSELRQRAMERRIYATIAKFKGPRYDASGLIEARYQIEAYQELYPREAAAAGLSDALVARLDESAAAQMLTVARWYLKRGDEASARLTLTRLVQRHPATGAAAEGYDELKKRKWIETEVPGAERKSERAKERELEEPEAGK
jgi:tetratricopeptide (TPR) repeat protein